MIRDIAATMTNHPTSQLDEVRKRNIVRVAVVGDKAYWVSDNIFYESDVIDGFIDNAAARPIDAYSLSGKDFRMLLDILDNM